MDAEYYLNLIRQSVDIQNETSRDRARFYRFLLLLTSGMIGVSISLTVNPSEYLYIQVVMSSLLLLLSLCLLSCVLVVYDHQQQRELLSKEFREAVQTAIRTQDLVKGVKVDPKKRTEVCEKIVLILLLVSTLCYVSLAIFWLIYLPR